MPMALTKLLKSEFSPDEITAKARELAQANYKRSEIEQEKKTIDKQMAAQIEEQNGIIKRISEQITTGWEMRNVECRIDLDQPNPGMKSVIRLDTGEIVSVERMTDEDRQLALDLEAKAEADKWANAPVIPEARRLNEPGPVEGDGFTILDAEPEEK